jgi:uncharacterized protein YbaP (TraB family)
VKLLRHLGISTALALGLATPALADPALWKVSDADSSIYLFGSVHIFTKQVDWRTPQFDRILESADHVYFEVVMDIEAYSTITQVTLTKGMFHDGRTLSDVLSKEEYDKLAEAASTLKVDMVTLDRMRPWLAAMTLVNAAYPNTSAGVELLVDADVPKERKRGLETAAEQMGFLSDMALDEQVNQLMSAVEGIESGAISELEPMIDAWQSGDTGSLAAQFEEQVTERDRAMYERLLTDRNARWMTELEKLLADNDQSLVIVGAGHLVGAEGVPALLKAEGYTVERIDQSPTGARPATGVKTVSRR